METLNIARPDYNPKVSKIPELIGKHPGTIAPVIKYRPQAVQIVTPVSGSRVSGKIEIKVRIRDGYPEVSDNLKKIVVTVNGEKFEFDQSPCSIFYDTAPLGFRIMKIKAEAIGKGEGGENEALSSYYINIAAENGAFDRTKPLILFTGVIEPKLTNIDKPWTPQMYKDCYLFSKNIMDHLMHYGFVPSFLKEVDQLSVLIDPTQPKKGFEEYTPVKLIDVLGREKGPGQEKTYTEMIPDCIWMEPTKTRLGTVLRGYHTPNSFTSNDMADIYEVFAARVCTYYNQFEKFSGMRGWDQTQMLFNDIMGRLEKSGYNFPWEPYSLLIGEKPHTLKEKIKKHVLQNNISSVLLSDYLTDLSDFEDAKCLWEEAQEAVDLVAQETGKKLQLAVLWSTGGRLMGIHPGFADAALKVTQNEIESSRIPENAKLGMILGEHGYPPGNGDEDVIGINMERVRQNMRSHYDRKLKGLRKGYTEYHLGMNEFNNNPESYQIGSMEWMVDYLHRGFDCIIFQPYYFTNETIDLFEHLRHWAFEVDGVDGHEFHGGHEVLDNYRSDFNFRGTRIIITGSIVGRYEKDGAKSPFLKEGYNLFTGAIAEQIGERIEELGVPSI